LPGQCVLSRGGSASVISTTRSIVSAVSGGLPRIHRLKAVLATLVSPRRGSEAIAGTEAVNRAECCRARSESSGANG